MNIIDNQQTTPLLSGDCIEAKRQELKRYFHNSWQTYESLFSLINNDIAYYLRPEPLRHPLIFYYGHTATFYINKLMLGKFIDKRINQRLEAICAVGVDEMSWDDLDSEHYDWPSVDEVKEYRHQVASLIDSLIDNMELELPISQDSLAWVILMGCEHERIHIETSSVIIRMLPLEHVSQNGQWLPCLQTGKSPENSLVNLAGRTVTLGKITEDNTYGWDNEYGQAEVEVPSFKTAKYLVSNQEFLAFIEAGGYQQKDFWTEEGQRWLEYTQSTMPRFWLQKGGEYYQRNLVEEIKLPLNWPVEVNQLEASAFCQWKANQSGKNIRLPTEPEWYLMRNLLAGDMPSWQQIPGNINLAQFASSSPVDEYGTSGIYDIVGNVWQWTESTIDGFSGFAVHPLYDDFSTPTFDGKHNLIKGGSWISTGNEAIQSSRYAFRRHFFQHAGFRYVEASTEDLPLVQSNHYVTNSDECQQLESHYGENYLNTENYCLQISRSLLKHIDKQQVATKRLLNLGTSVGRVAFELSAHFEHIDAVDFSARYIQHGVKLQTGTSVRYVTKNEGEILDYHEVNLDKLGLVGKGKNIRFSQGDVSNLKPIYTDYDVVVLQHSLERGYGITPFNDNFYRRLKPNSLLIIISDYQFDNAEIEQDKWLGGKKVNGENVFGIDGISQALAGKFELVSQQELTRVLKESNRKYRVSTPELTVWRKL